MKIDNFKPESVKVFCNSQVYYINGVNLSEIREGNKVLLKEGQICQLYVQYCSDPIKDKIIGGACLTAIVENFSRPCKIEGRPGLRFTVKTFKNEDDIWQTN